jgi:hypothetical protein
MDGKCHQEFRAFAGNALDLNASPHGSKFAHILERRYEISQAAIVGQSIGNLFPNPDLGRPGRTHCVRSAIA